MWPTIAAIGGVKITVMGLVLAAGFVTASFIIWRRMRGDYDEEDILSGLLWLAVVVWAASRWEWTPWKTATLPVTVAVSILAIWWWCRWKKWNFWEWLDELGVAGLGLAAAAGIGYGPAGLAAAAVAAAGMATGWVLRRYYRRIRWYKSGKVGLAGLTAVVWWAGIQAVVAKHEGVWVYLLAWTGVAAGISIYLRSGRKASEDLNNLWPKLHLKKH